MSLAAPRLRPRFLLGPMFFVAIVRLFVGGLMVVVLRPRWDEAWRLLSGDAVRSLDVGVSVLAAAALARPLFALPSLLVRYATTLAALAFLALDALAAAVRLSSGHPLAWREIRRAVVAPHAFASAGHWLSDPWHLAVAALVSLILLLAGLWLSRVVDNAWSAAGEAPGSQLVLFVAGLVLLSWALHRFAGAGPASGDIARWVAG